MNLRTPTATKVLGGLALLLIAAAGWLLALGPQTAALAEVRVQIQDARAQNGVLAQQLVALQEQAAHLGRTRATSRALAAKFPPTADQPGLFREVTRAATDAGIGPKDVTALTPTPPTVGAVDPASGVQLAASTGAADLARQTVTVSVEGDYAATQELLENLERMSRAYLVNSVTLGTGTSGGTFTTTITGDMFVMPPAEDPGPSVGSSASKIP